MKITEFTDRKTVRDFLDMSRVIFAVFARNTVSTMNAPRRAIRRTWCPLAVNCAQLMPRTAQVSTPGLMPLPRHTVLNSVSISSVANTVFDSKGLFV